MPASDYFTATSYTDYNEQPEYISFQLLGSGTITFKHNTTKYGVPNWYFTVIGGGGGGGGGGGTDHGGGGGGGAGAGGKIYFRTNHNVPYLYVVGTEGGGGPGNNNGGNGTLSSITFSLTEYIIAEGGHGGRGYYSARGGGAGGGLTPVGVCSIINGVSGAGGDGHKISPTILAQPGTDQSPISIENYPNTVINVGGGGGGGETTGGGGGNGIGGAVDGSAVNDGEAGIAYGGGGGGGRKTTSVSSGAKGKEGAIFVYISIYDCIFCGTSRNGCEWNPCLTTETTEWTRAHTDCVDISGATLNNRAMTYDDLSEKRKATIFQYKNNNAGFSKKQLYSRLARGIGRQRGQSFATQSDTYTNPNTHNLVLDASSVLLCPSGVTKNWAWTSQNDTPGPVIKITNEPSVPLTNYIVRRTYLAGNNKWPQFGWAPGMDGFPVRKMGKK